MTAAETSTQRKPSWLKVRFPTDPDFFRVSGLLKEKNLHTICRSARCPNIGECWARKTATFLILGDVCTRDCAFCAVGRGAPSPLSSDEAERVAQAARSLELRYVVVTSVTRDDLDDGGAGHFARVISAVRRLNPEARIEVLVPDFGGRRSALDRVLEAGPDVLNHNLEVPAALYPLVNRDSSRYGRSLRILEWAKEAGSVTKSGLMVGLGETRENIDSTLDDLRDVGCDLLTVGQYLQPGPRNLPVARYYSPEEFDQLKIRALDRGFTAVEAGPLVRSSYMAHRLFRSKDSPTEAESHSTQESRR